MSEAELNDKVRLSAFNQRNAEAETIVKKALNKSEGFLWQVD